MATVGEDMEKDKDGDILVKKDDVLTRGEGKLNATDLNYLFVYGCAQNSVVKDKNMLVKGIKQELRLACVNKTVEFPACLSKLAIHEGSSSITSSSSFNVKL
eukprot:CAMPEP_0116882682 /NCGR_PEP_ID=MMETSP0463-20121206/15005_1 /TAXON_ID=181622 /ORGANISM="Strombidinopsis sp, Strain SopsisLIS2011" /LENGTH=101 /DNA_ID=CAMNT_0004536293 /DNA_START=538 /DNA_END=843 /DNA_ORIENTATION=-